MKKKLKLIFGIFFITPVLMLLAIYIGLTAYYADSFMFGIFVNGVYVTGKTPEEINDKLLERVEEKPLEITDKSGETITIDLAQSDYKVTYLPALEKLHKTQNPFLWFRGLSGDYVEYTVEPSGMFDEEKLKEIIYNCSFVKTAGDKNRIKIEIEKTPKGYQLVDTTKNLLNKERTLEAVKNALKEGNTSVDLAEADCYEEAELSARMKETLKLWEKIEQFQAGSITYKMDGAEEIVDAAVTSDWILLDDEGEFLLDDEQQLQLDEEKLKEYVNALCEKYDTTNKERTLLATRGDVVTIPAGTYGNKINKKAEIEYLLEAFSEKRVEEHVPEYSQRAWGTDGDDIGDTYIEVDLTNQMLYYYAQGSKVLETPVVTGCTGKGNGTPAKACYIYYKQKKRVLRGEDYETPVDYWMAVYGNIGIHDATWRRKFGGTIYKYSGSHGCINTPYQEVKKLYELAQEGTPVMIFY